MGLYELTRLLFLFLFDFGMDIMLAGCICGMMLVF